MNARLCRYCASELVAGRMFVCGDCDRAMPAAMAATKGDLDAAVERFLRARPEAKQKALFVEGEVEAS